MADELLNLADEPVENTDAEYTQTPADKTEPLHEDAPKFKTAAEKKKYIHDLKKKKEDERKALLKAEREETKRQQREMDRISGKTGRRRKLLVVIIIMLAAGAGVYFYMKMPKHPAIEHPKPKPDIVNVQDSIAEGVQKLKSKLSDMKDEAKTSKKQDAKSERKEQSDGKWGITGPCFVISHSSMKSESLAQRTVGKLKIEGFTTGYYWIPDISAGGNEYFKVYIGPFNTEDEAVAKLEDVRKYSPRAYIVEIK